MDRNPFDRILGEGMGGAPDFHRPDLSTPEGVMQRQLQLLERSRRFNLMHEQVRARLREQQQAMIADLPRRITDALTTTKTVRQDGPVPPVHRYWLGRLLNRRRTR